MGEIGLTNHLSVTFCTTVTDKMDTRYDLFVLLMYGSIDAETKDLQKKEKWLKNRCFFFLMFKLNI